MRRHTTSDGNDPQERLLKAGEEIFALVGYRQATIRRISQRANVNVALVSYYFGGKKQLYRAVLEQSMAHSFQRHVSSSRPPSHATPGERLHAFVVALLSHVLDKTDYASNGRLMAREMVEPSFALDIVVDKIIRPWSEEAGSIVRAFLGPEVTDEDVFLYEQTVIVAQCLHYRHNRPILDRLHPSLQCGPENIRRLAEHITRFSLGALRAFRRPTTWTRTSAEVNERSQPDRRVINSSPMRRKTHQDGGPKERLVNAGEDVFALLGYQHATIREISQRANVNVAMVNYYFGGKEALYREVLERSLRESVDRYVAASRPPDNASPAERLHAFVLALLSHVLDEGSASIGRLMSREMTEPTTALDTVVDKVIRPRSKEAILIVRAFLGPEASDEDVILYEQSIVAQCLHQRHNRPILDRLRPSVKYGPTHTQRLAHFITRSSVGALLAFRLASKESPT